LDVLDIGLRGYKQITDAYLVALARHNGARLATFDAAMATLPGGLGSAVELIP
jgi:predicted nucleic acid-binding protein